MRLVVRFPTHRVLSCLGHYWWGQTRKWAHFAVKFPFAACFWYKNFWNIGRKCDFFWSQQPQIRERIGIPGHFSCPTQIFPKKSGVERSSTPLFFGIFCGRECRTLTNDIFPSVFFFFFEKGPQWNIVDFLFFFFKKKQKNQKKPKKKKSCRLDFRLASAQEGLRLPFPLARQSRCPVTPGKK